MHLGLKRGLEFMKKDLRREYTDTILFMGRLYSYDLAAVAMLCTSENKTTYYQVAYAICSPNDSFSLQDAEAYLGWRVQKESNHPYRFAINLSKSGGVKVNRLTRLIESHIRMDLITQRVLLPARMYKNSLKDLPMDSPGLRHIPKKERVEYWQQRALVRKNREMKKSLDKLRGIGHEKEKPV